MPTAAGTAELLGVRAAASALDCIPSTFSRDLREFPALNIGTKTRPKVDVEALRRHRVENTNPSLRTAEQ